MAIWRLLMTGGRRARACVAHYWMRWVVGPDRWAGGRGPWRLPFGGDLVESKTTCPRSLVTFFLSFWFRLRRCSPLIFFPPILKSEKRAPTWLCRILIVNNGKPLKQYYYNPIDDGNNNIVIVRFHVHRRMVC